MNEIVQAPSGSDAVLLHSFESLVEGTGHCFTYQLDAKIYQGFLALFGDNNPLHVDPETARASGFDGPVMHGGILNGFHSHFIGTRFPGRDSLLLLTRFSYLQACFLGDQIEIKATVKQRNESQRVVVLGLEFFCTNRSLKVARAETMVKVRQPAWQT